MKESEKFIFGRREKEYGSRLEQRLWLGVESWKGLARRAICTEKAAQKEAEKFYLLE